MAFDPNGDVYLGDGVYASFDGWNIWLAVDKHSNRVVALDPDVLKALNAYAKAIDEHYEALAGETAADMP